MSFFIDTEGTTNASQSSTLTLPTYTKLITDSDDETPTKNIKGKISI